MGVYDRQVDTALRLITKKGGVVKFFEKAANNPVDPNKPWRGSKGDPTKYEAQAVLLDYDIQVQSLKPYAKNMLVAAASIDVEITDEMFVELPDGSVYEVRHVTEVNPNMQQIILWDLEVSEWGSTLNRP